MEYLNAYKLKQRLLTENEGKSLDELIKGEEVKTANGLCYQIEKESTIKLNTLSSKKAEEKILSDLKILSGIGEVREQRLKDEGYCTIEDLRDHEKFAGEASKFLSHLKNRDSCEIEDWICRFYPRSHPLLLYSSSFKHDHEFIFLDIETMGLHSSPIILLGIASVSDNKINVKQYLSRNTGEEKAVLDSFISDIEPSSVFVTFNGQTFDLPFIKDRIRYFNLKDNINHSHFDMLHFSRRQWSGETMNCQLQTLETHLFNILRDDDVPSGLVPEFYETYLKTGNAGPLIPIVKHNQQDIITVAMIFSRLHELHAHY